MEIELSDIDKGILRELYKKSHSRSYLCKKLERPRSTIWDHYLFLNQNKLVDIRINRIDKKGRPPVFFYLTKIGKKFVEENKLWEN